MTRIILSVAVMSSLAFAGGDFTKAVEPAVVPVIPVVEEAGPFYLGLGLSALSTRRSDVSLNIFNDKGGQDRTGDVLVMAGYDFNEYIALEGRYMASVFEEDVLTRDSWGIYAKPQYPINEMFSVYALLGYGGVSVDGKGSALIPANRSDVDDSGFQWGVGASYAATENISIFADWVSVARDMDADIFMGSVFEDMDSDAFSLGVTYNF